MKITGRKSGNPNIIELFYKAVTKEQSHHSGIHVSSLSYECLRRAYYSQIYGEGLFSAKTLMTFWIGRELHKTQILAHHELSVDWNGIIGTCDEYENGLLLDKKTCTMIPTYVSPHHAKQVEYYALMLSKQYKIVNQAYILYIDVANKKVKALKVKLRQLSIIEDELTRKRDMLKNSIESKTPPSRHINWLCDHCAFASKCFEYVEPVDPVDEDEPAPDDNSM